MDRQTLLDLIPAYVLGALDPDELREFEAWLAGDPQAQELVAEYQSFTDFLVLTTPIQTAPANLADDLRRRLMVDSETTATFQPTERRPIQLQRRSWPLRILAAAAVIAVVLAGLIWLALPKNCDAPCRYEQITAQTNAIRIALVPTGDQTIEGELAAIPNSTDAVIRVNLDTLPEDKTYQLWLIDEDGPKSGGLWPKASGITHILLPLDKPLDEYQAFGMSIEPDEGSESPTDIIFTVPAREA